MAEPNGKTEPPRTDRGEADTPDVDSAGVYYVPIDVFEWRPGREAAGTETAPPSDDDPRAKPSVSR